MTDFDGGDKKRKFAELENDPVDPDMVNPSPQKKRRIVTARRRGTKRKRDPLVTDTLVRREKPRKKRRFLYPDLLCLLGTRQFSCVILLCPLQQQPPPLPPPSDPNPEPEDDVEIEEEPKWYYAVAGKYEPDETDDVALVWIDLVEIEWFDSRAHLDRVEFNEQNPWTPLRQLVIEVGGYDRPNGIPTVPVVTREGKMAVEEGVWFQAKVSFSEPEELEGAIEGECYEQLPSLHYEDPEPAWLIGVKDVGAMKSALEEVYSILPEDSTGQHAAVMNQRVAFVGVFDIGQGNCNALYNDDCHPFLYYDFGVAVEGYKRTRPAAFDPCYAGNPTVVLSHFDGDHRELAVHKPRAFHFPWAVIENKPVASDKNFFNKLTHVRVWPNNQLCFEEYPWGFVLRADWPGHHNKDIDKNEIGLVALVRVQDDSNAPPPGQRRALDAAGTRPEIFPDERYVLLTGDAMFEHVASCRAGDLHGKIVGILAAHHGAKDGLVEKHIPLAAPPLSGLPPTVVFSYGIFHVTSGQNPRGKHAYSKGGGSGHPFPEAVEMYRLRGYHHIQRTAEDADVTLLNTPATHVVVVHPRHGKAHNEDVTISGAAHGAFNGGPWAIRVLDDDHYAIPVNRDGTLRSEVGPNVRSASEVLVYDPEGVNWCFVRRPGHGYGNGTNVVVAGATNNSGGTPVHVLNNNVFAVQLGANAAQIDADATVDGNPAVIYHVPNGHSLVRHELHGFAMGTTPSIVLNGVGPNPVVVLDEDHYVWPASNNGGGNPSTANQDAAVNVRIIGAATGTGLVYHPGRVIAGGTQVTLRFYKGTVFEPNNAAPHTTTQVPNLPDYSTVNDRYNKHSSDPVRAEIAGVLATRRHCLLGWRGPNAPPVGANALAIRNAAQAYEQAARDARAVYDQARAAEVVADAAQAASKITGSDEDDVADAAELVMTQPRFQNLQPTAATRALLRRKIAEARRDANRNDAHKTIREAHTRLRDAALRATGAAEARARDAVAAVHASGGPPSPQQVHCQKPLMAQHAAAAKLAPDPVVNVGPRAGGTALPPPGGLVAAVTEPAELLTFPNGESLVHHPGHGFGAGKQVRVRGTGNVAIDGDRNAAVVDANHYTIDASGGASALFASASVGLPATLLDCGPGQCLMHFPGGTGGLDQVTLTNTDGGRWDGAHPVIEIVDQDHYKLGVTKLAGNASGKVGGTDVDLVDDGTSTKVKHTNHGRGLCDVVMSGAPDPVLDGAHTVTEIVDANQYKTNKTVLLAVNGPAKVNGVDVTVSADNAGCTVTHNGHGRGLRVATLHTSSDGAFDGSHNVARVLDGDWAVLDFSAGAAKKVTAKVGADDVTIFDKAAGTSLLLEAQASGHWAAGARAELVGSTNGDHDGEHTLTAVGGAADLRSIPHSVDAPRKDDVHLHQPVTLIDHAADDGVVRHGNHGLRGNPNVTISGAAQGVFNAAHAVTVLSSNYYALPVGHNAATVQNVNADVTRTALAIAGPGPAAGIPRPGVTIAGVAPPHDATLNGHHATTRIVGGNSYCIAVTTGVAVNGIAGTADTGLGPQAVTIDDDGVGECTVTMNAGNHDLGTGTVTITNAANGAYNGVHVVTLVTDDSTYTINFTNGLAANNVRSKCNGSVAYIDDDGIGTCTIQHANPHQRAVHQDPPIAGDRCVPAGCSFINLVRP